MTNDFIQKAIGNDAGAFTAKAKRHGQTPMEFAKEVLANKEDYPLKTERQAVLARTLSKVRKHKRNRG